jgi:hypothetical protein
VWAILGALVAVGAVAAFVLLRPSDEVAPFRTSTDAPPDSLVLVDRGDGRPLATVPLRAEPARLAYGDGAFWAAAPEDGVVVRVDERTREAKRFPIGDEPYDVAVGGGAVWVPDHDLHRLFRLDPDTGDLRRTEDFGLPAVAVGYGGGAVWLVVASGDVLRIDPDSLEVTRTEPRLVVATENAEPKLAFQDGTVWISSPASTSLARVDATGSSSAQEAIGITSVAANEDGVWFGVDSGLLTGVGDEHVEVGTRPLDLGSSDHEVWVAAYDDRALKRVESDAGRMTGTVTLGRSPVAVAVGNELVAVAVQS